LRSRPSFETARGEEPRASSGRGIIDCADMIRASEKLHQVAAEARTF
jgi:hypothetical protein